MNKQQGIAHLNIIVASILVSVAVAGAFWRVTSNNIENKQYINETTNEVSIENKNDTSSTLESEEPEVKEGDDEKSNSSTDHVQDKSKVEEKTSETPTAIKPSTKPKSTSNCVPSDANQYQTTNTDKSNLQFLRSNAYSKASSFADALEFAGLGGTVESNKVVVFVPNDYVFSNNLTEAQKIYMNASPENMKSVVGWHVVTSCVIWDGQLDSTNTTVTIQTLNGPVTYTPGSSGDINGTSIAIWDWFTSNGAIHYIVDFIAPPSI